MSVSVTSVFLLDDFLCCILPGSQISLLESEMAWVGFENGGNGSQRKTGRVCSFSKCLSNSSYGPGTSLVVSKPEDSLSCWR